MAFITPPTPPSPWTTAFVGFLRAEQERIRQREWEKSQEQSAGSGGLGAGLGAAVGTGLGALLAVPTGGLSVVAGAVIGGGIGGGLGGTAGALIDPPTRGGSVDRSAQYGQVGGYLAQGTQAALSGYQQHTQRQAAIDALTTGGGADISGIGGMPANYQAPSGGGMSRGQAEKFVDAWGSPAEALQWITKSNARTQYQQQGQANRAAHQEQAYQNAGVLQKAMTEELRVRGKDRYDLKKYGGYTSELVQGDPTFQEFASRLTEMEAGRRGPMIDETADALPAFFDDVEGSGVEGISHRDVFRRFLQNFTQQADAKRQGMVQQGQARAEQAGQIRKQVQAGQIQQLTDQDLAKAGLERYVTGKDRQGFESLEVGADYVRNQHNWRPEHQKAALEAIAKRRKQLSAGGKPGTGVREKQITPQQELQQGHGKTWAYNPATGESIRYNPKTGEPKYEQGKSRSEIGILQKNIRLWDSLGRSVGQPWTDPDTGARMTRNKDYELETLVKPEDMFGGVDYQKARQWAEKSAGTDETGKPNRVTTGDVLTEIRLEQDVKKRLRAGAPEPRPGRFAVPRGPALAGDAPMPPQPATPNATPNATLRSAPQGPPPAHQAAAQFIDQYDVAKRQGRLAPGVKANAKEHARMLLAALLEKAGSRAGSEAEQTMVRRLLGIIEG